MKPITALLLFCLFTLPAAAQTFDPVQPLELKSATPEKQEGETYVRHITHELMEWPEARRAAEEFLALKEQGWQPTASKATAQLGDTLTFRVANSETSSVDEHDFRLMAEAEDFYVWGQLSEIDNGRITDEIVAGLTEALATKTPAGSFNPDAGIIVNNEAVFGAPPNIDGDGKTDVLLVDVQDGYDGSGGFVGGFVTTLDLGPSGNRRDVLYLDTYPSLSLGIDDVAYFAAHEYQHLIHFNYDLQELTFVNEGLSEWAGVVNGYEFRPISYLSDPGRYNVNLLRWSGSLSDLVFDDYERGGLFTNYIADRIGVLETGAITRQTFEGGGGYTQALDAAGTGLTLTDLLIDFHIANLLNDVARDPRFGYTTAHRQGLHAVPVLQADGRTATETPATTVSIRSGAAQFLVWDDVTDFALTLELTRGLATQVQPRLLLFQGDSFTEQSLDFSASPQLFTGSYERIALVVPNVDLVTTEIPLVRYSAMWSSNVTYTSETIRYDSGQTGTPEGSNPFFSLGAGGAGAVATRFDVPSEGAILDKVFLAPYFLSQFSNGGQPATAPRNLTLKIWSADTEGEPETELLSMDMADPRTGAATTTLSYFEVDLSSFADQLTGLTGPLLVGYTNVGTDQNYFIVGVSPSSSDVDVSFIGNVSSGNWAPLWSVQFQGGGPDEFPVRNTVVPIRASFLVPNEPVADEDIAELPQRLTLDQNYPNPFNPSTTIRYAVPQSGAVTLKVFDVLGREVATLVDGVQPAGEHTVSLDASRWASGMYFYTVNADGRQQTRQMLLVK